VDSAGRWRTLQLHLKSAHAAREAGDVQLARKEVDAALLIDPDYLAARFLRESLADATLTHPQPRQAPVQATASQPKRQPRDIPSDTFSSLEERTRRRRIEQRIGAARTAIVHGRFAEADAALDELNELDPALPVVPAIAAELREARGASKRTPGARGASKRTDASRGAGKRRGLVLLVGVAAALAGAVAGTLAGRATQANSELSSVESMAAALVARAIPMFSGAVPDVPSTLPAELVEAPRAFQATQDPFVTRVAPVPDPLPPPAPAIKPRAPVEAPARVAERAPAAAVPVERLSTAAVPADRAVDTPAPATPHSDPPPASAPGLAVDDSALIRDALQRYRRAYNALDARLAHAVYPGVDERALTRAFEGLQSQSLDFEACTVDLIGMSARAVCRGSARYVPRIGSRAPRAEPRVWTFRLRKDEGDWTIESAWTNR
jgi:hypothetical protein